MMNETMDFGFRPAAVLAGLLVLLLSVDSPARAPSRPDSRLSGERLAESAQASPSRPGPEPSAAAAGPVVRNELPAAVPSGAKKIVEYGWDVPDPGFLRAHVREMEQRPFDGVIFRLRRYNHAFDPRPWPADSLAAQEQELQQIPWRRFTDNFLCLLSANKWQMDWRDDAQWQVIQAHLRATARAARLGGCVGICFDPEPYGPSPWQVPDGMDSVACRQLAAQVRLRGEQFITALQSELPAVKLLTLYGFTVFGDLAGEPDPARFRQRLAGHAYRLYVPFLEGILDGLGPDARLIDGNERSYYYQDSEAFLRAFHVMRQENARLVGPELRGRYRAYLDAGMALYVDHLLGMRPPASRYLSHYLSAQDRLRWFEHNVYWALRTTDEYVWCYGERMDWWKGDYPQGLDSVITAARSRVASGRPLDFHLADLLERGQKVMDQTLAERLVRRSARVPWLPVAVPPPRIDGALTDTCWVQAAVELEPFQPPLDGKALQAGTTARVVADDQALYIAVRCDEPHMDQVMAEGKRHDDTMWHGDTMEFLFSRGEQPEPYVHLMLNPDGVRWDALTVSGKEDVGWNDPWRSAVVRGAGAWTVEVAIPWSTLGGCPEPGARRRVNLCRQRHEGHELSAWSMILHGFLDPAEFGTWTFGREPAGHEGGR